MAGGERYKPLGADIARKEIVMSKAKKSKAETCPTCDKAECFACENGYCVILTNNQFNRGCPFFKTREQANERYDRRAHNGEMGS